MGIYVYYDEESFEITRLSRRNRPVQDAGGKSGWLAEQDNLLAEEASPRGRSVAHPRRYAEDC